MSLFVQKRTYQGIAMYLAGFAATTLGCSAPPADGGDTGGTDDDGAELQLAQATDCARPPADSDPKAVEAYDRVNAYRKAAGLRCATFVPEIAGAAQAHCGYYVANTGACVANPHREVAGCTMFRAERFSDRLKAAAYTGNPAYEAMTYVGAGAKAVDKWVDSVWHRIPVLSPWVSDLGYGSVKACDTMDFGWAAAPGSPAPMTYPFDGQTKIPRSFDGRTESPALPAPPKGWPSGYPIMVYASDLQVSSHQLFDDKMNAVDHTWIAPGDAASMGILINELAMYAHAPLKKATTYRVVVEGTRKGEPVHLDWTFTTK
jgi:uncharacterized protein YkwD